MNSKNYKYKHGVPSILSQVILRLLNYVKAPAQLQFFHRTVDIEREIESTQEVDLSEYKTMLNSDLTIMVGLVLLKNKHLSVLHLSSLNLYDIDL